MKLYITSFWAIILLLVTSCNSQKEVVSVPTPPNPKTPELSSKLVVVSFEQTACYGTCPVHKMNIFGNGFATYKGGRNVKQTGDLIGNISKEKLQEILAKANELNFYELEEEYTANMTDLPTTIILINDGTKKHKVVAYANYPDNLKVFITYLFEITQNTNWSSNM
jgi:hypothetical protein